MSHWYDIFLWFWMGTWVLAAVCVSILGLLKVGITGSWFSPGWLEEFDAADKLILKIAGYALLAGFISLVVYFIFYII